MFLVKNKKHTKIILAADPDVRQSGIATLADRGTLMARAMTKNEILFSKKKPPSC